MFSSTTIGKPKVKSPGRKMLRAWQYKVPASGIDSPTKPLAKSSQGVPAASTSPTKANSDSSTSTASTNAPTELGGGSGSGGPVIEDIFSDLRDKYDVDPGELGSGMYGVVRKCTSRESGDVLAVKTVRKSRVSQLQILRQEVRLLREVSHPHIIRLVDVFEDKEDVNLVTELATGGELFDRIIAKKQTDAGCHTENEAAVIVRQILDALSYLHDERDIVHRDLKPENFLLASDADDAPVKIIDFGYAVRHIPKKDGPLKDDVGTPLYMAPEVIQSKQKGKGGGYGRQCDVWSVGIIAYTLLCGHPPFNGPDERSICESVVEGRFRFASPPWEKVGVDAKDFICKMLKKDPKMRMSAGEARRHQWIRKKAPCEGDDQLGEAPYSAKDLAGGGKKGGGGSDSKRKEAEKRRIARRMLSPSRFTY